MANLRRLKKEINYMTLDLFHTLLFVSADKNADQDKLSQLFVKVSDFRNSFIARANGFDTKADKKTTRAYFHALNADLAKEFNALAEEVVKS